MKKIISLTAICILLTACGGNKPVNKFNDEAYLNAESVPPLEIPEELENKTYIEAFYPAPQGEYPEPGSEPKSLLPPEMGELIADEDPEEIKEIQKELE